MTAAIIRSFFVLALLLPFNLQAPQAPSGAPLPQFGRDTVLVYKSSNEAEGAFIVRIAQFQPDRYIEWEDSTTQGTILMPAKTVEEARGLANFQLFEAGVDTRGKNATTLWLSRRIYRELKQGPKVKFDVDGLPTLVTVLGVDRMDVDVNRVPTSVPVLKTRDERNSERWFLDLEDNALLVNLLVRDYRQRLTSITTDKANTLRWIKDKKR